MEQHSAFQATVQKLDRAASRGSSLAEKDMRFHTLLERAVRKKIAPEGGANPTISYLRRIGFS